MMVYEGDLGNKKNKSGCCSGQYSNSMTGPAYQESSFTSFEKNNFSMLSSICDQTIKD